MRRPETDLAADPSPRPSGRAGACVVIAEFEARDDSLEGFVALASGFARECLDNETGCRQFDVVRLESTPRGVLFYEIYDDAAAFDAHCRSPHLTRFKAAFAHLIVAERPLRKGLARP